MHLPPLYRRNQPGCFLILALLLFAGNSSAQQLLDEKRVIFLAETPVMVGWHRDSSYQRFTPTPKEIDSTDVVLLRYLQGTIKNDDSSSLLSDYYRQYVGLLLKGRKYIYINASCNKPGYFLQNTHYPKGGGQCYFQTVVDPWISRRVETFYFNAPK